MDWLFALLLMHWPYLVAFAAGWWARGNFAKWSYEVITGKR